MRVSEYLRDSLIFLDIDAKDKMEAIANIVHLIEKTHALSDAEKFLQEVYERESLGSTGIGKGVAVPHARTLSTKQITLAIARLSKGVDFDAEDKEPVRLIFLLGTPQKAVGEYLKVLARLSKMLHENGLRKKLIKAQSAVEVRKIIEDAESY